MSIADQIRRLISGQPGQTITLPAETLSKLLDEITTLKNEIEEINEHS